MPIQINYECVKTPEKSEPVLADKEIIMAALNIKYMNFGADFIKVYTVGYNMIMNT